MKLELSKYISQLNLPKKDSHKGENGKLLLIGGSDLFHAASKWSLDVASKIVDMVFYSSVASNNQLVLQTKSQFWNGIVIERDSLDDYMDEADCVLIGPGMERNELTQNLVNDLLTKYPSKKFVIDAGALQMVDPNLLNVNHIVTPHTKEMKKLQQRANDAQVDLEQKRVTILLKGVVDEVSWFENHSKDKSKHRCDNCIDSCDDGWQKFSISIEGGNAGMTKGGTGDVLAGLVSAIYCKNTASVASITGSYVNKLAGDQLYKSVGPFFNASDLVEQVPKTFWQVVESVNKT